MSDQDGMNDSALRPASLAHLRAKCAAYKARFDDYNSRCQRLILQCPETSELSSMMRKALDMSFAPMFISMLEERSDELNSLRTISVEEGMNKL